jgi:hypothetical protein
MLRGSCRPELAIQSSPSCRPLQTETDGLRLIVADFGCNERVCCGTVRVGDCDMRGNGERQAYSGRPLSYVGNASQNIIEWVPITRHKLKTYKTIIIVINHYKTLFEDI